MDNLAKTSRNLLGWYAVGLVLLAVAAYFPTYASIVSKWNSDMTFSHGFLVVAVSGWLLWRCRTELMTTEWRPGLLGLAAVATLACAWLIGAGAGVLVIQQLAVVAMISAIVLAVLGRHAFYTVAFPLAFLLFAVPFGHGLVPGLMQVTADIAVSALHATGIPVYRSDLLLSIPGGDFEVARACSGLNYLVTGVVLGTLYAYLTYRTWCKRLLFIAASIIIPIAANGVRVYLTVAAAHWSGMRLGIGYDHIVFGRVMFLLVMFGMFWIGLRWRDDWRANDRQSGQVALVGSEPMPRRMWIVPVLVALLVIAAPAYLSAARFVATSASIDWSMAIEMPRSSAGWSQLAHESSGWRPLFEGAFTEKAVTFANQKGDEVDVFVGVYPIGRIDGREMISYRNRMYRSEHTRLISEENIALLLGGQPVVVRQFIVTEGRETRLVWYWFMVGEVPAATRTRAKVLEALAFLSGNAADARVIAVSTVIGSVGEESDRLLEFMEALDPCPRSGFRPASCGR